MKLEDFKVGFLMVGCSQDICYDIKARWKLEDRPTILVASHGGLIKDFMTFLVEQKGCTLPTDNMSYKGISPNCGFTKLTLRLNTDQELISIHCNDLYNGQHLQGLDCLATKNHHLSPLAAANVEEEQKQRNRNLNSNSNLNNRNQQQQQALAQN